MKQAIIDIGSNSMRLTLYEIGSKCFKILFKEKIMAGLAGYVDDGVLSDDGIERAYTGLLDFRNTLESLNIKNVAVFATASLRNIKNTEQVVTAIRVATGFQVEVITGEEEALLGYIGAMNEIQLVSGTFADIGGASTEIVAFEDGAATVTTSFEVGSLNLFRLCVKKILPGGGSKKRIQAFIREKLTDEAISKYGTTNCLVCVGGTARAVLKIAQRLYGLPDTCNSISQSQLIKTCEILCECDKEAIELILKNEPDRIHTMIPGAMILQHIAVALKAETIVVSKYGVREGYLCQKMLNNQNDTLTPKTES